MLLSHLVYTHVDTANWHGTPCLELVLGGQLQVSLMDVVSSMDQAVEDMRLLGRVVVIDASVVNDNDPREVHELVKVLNGRGCHVMGRSDGTVYPLWFEDCQCKVAHVRGKWLNYKVDEVQYRPADDDKLDEPFVMENNAGAVKSLVLQSKRGMKELAAFNGQSRWSWTILVPKSWEYTVRLV